MTVFVSHSFKDKARLDDVCLALESKGIAFWKTEEMIAGAALREGLRNSIESCPACIFIATRNSLASGWCQAEIGAFWGARKPVVVYLADDNLRGDELPKQFQGDKWAETTREVLASVKVHLGKTADPARVSMRPGNVFWLGHDLARAIRVAKFEPDKWSELDRDLRQALHHVDEIGLQALDARALLLHALKAHRQTKTPTEEQRYDLVEAIAIAKNELGSKIERLQPGFKGYPTIETQNNLNDELRRQ